MHLTREEERFLNGEYGEALRLAMEVLVRVGEAMGAESMVPISHAHVSGVSYFSIGDYGVELLEELALKGAKVRVFTTANPFSMALAPDFMDRFGARYVEKQRRIVELLLSMGVHESFTCIPYILRTPRQGEHLAWAESSAVLYANSVLGAYTNREGGIVALMAGIAGRTYMAGVHLREFRVPRTLVRVVGSVKSRVIAGLLGLRIGAMSSGIPFVEFRGVSPADMPIGAVKQMLAAVGTASDLPMVVLEGVTPGYREYRRCADFVDRHTIRVEELVSELRREEGRGGVYITGCPHLDLEELKELAELVVRGVFDGYKEIWVALSPKVYRLGEELGIVQKLRELGVRFAVGACPVVTKLRLLGVKAVATDSAKAYSYIPKISGVTAVLRGW